MRWIDTPAARWRRSDSTAAGHTPHELGGEREAWLNLLADADAAEVAVRIESIRRQLRDNTFDLENRLDASIEALLDDLALPPVTP